MFIVGRGVMACGCVSGKCSCDKSKSAGKKADPAAGSSKDGSELSAINECYMSPRIEVAVSASDNPTSATIGSPVPSESRLSHHSAKLLTDALQNYLIEVPPPSQAVTVIKYVLSWIALLMFPSPSRIITSFVFKTPQVLTYHMKGDDEKRQRFMLTTQAFAEGKLRVAETVLHLPSLTSLIIEQAMTGPWTCFYAHTALGDRVACLMHKSEQANPQEKTLLYLHGTGCDLGNVVTSTMGILCDIVAGYNVCAIDYPGYGCSSGELGETSSFYAIEAVVETLQAERNVPASSLFIMGSSLGTGPAVYAATLFQLRGIILLGPFKSIIRIVYPKVRASWLQDILCSIDRIDHVQCPLLIMHGLNDSLVSPLHGLQLHKKATAPVNFFIMVSKGSHCLEGYRHVYRVILEFISFVDNNPSTFDYKRPPPPPK